MSRTQKKGFALAVLHVLLATTVTAKLFYDRETLPRAWAKVWLPKGSLQMRERYAQIDLVIDTDVESARVALFAEGGQLHGRRAENGRGVGYIFSVQGTKILNERVSLYFPRSLDPAFPLPGEELWVEVSVPKKGLPRPIRLGVKKDGVLTPLDPQ